MDSLGLRIAAAVAALAALGVWAGRSLAPGASVGALLVWAALAALALGLTVLGLAWFWATLNQWLLRHGARDADWLWFPADPPGLGGVAREHSGDPTPPPITAQAHRQSLARRR